MLQYRMGLRENKVMQRVTGKMTDDEIAAVVDYVATF
jgi:cytochrome c553